MQGHRPTIESAVFVLRHAVVSDDAIVWPEGIATGQLSAATDTLKNPWNSN